MSGDVKRTCPACDAPLIQQRSESLGMFNARKYCNQQCVHTVQRHPREHGTERGFRQHRRLKEPLCADCRRFREETRAANPDALIAARAKEKAQRRAGRRLVETYRAHYLELCAEEYVKAGLR